MVQGRIFSVTSLALLGIALAGCGPNSETRTRASVAEIAAAHDRIDQLLAAGDRDQAEAQLVVFQDLFLAFEGPEKPAFRTDVDLQALRILARTPGVDWHMVFGELLTLEAANREFSPRQKARFTALYFMSLEAVNHDQLLSADNRGRLRDVGLPCEHLDAWENQRLSAIQDRLTQQRPELRLLLLRPEDHELEVISSSPDEATIAATVRDQPWDEITFVVLRRDAKNELGISGSLSPEDGLAVHFCEDGERHVGPLAALDEGISLLLSYSRGDGRWRRSVSWE